MSSELVEAWQMSNEVNLYLLRQLPNYYLHDRYSSRTRSVGDQFAHMHSVRRRWLEHAAAELAGKIPRISKDAEPTAEELIEALQASEEAISTFLERCDSEGAVPGWIGSPTTFLAYLVAHEAHHRGLAMAAMRVSGHKAPKELVYGQWDWGKKRSHR